MVIATRNGRQRTFTDSQWKSMQGDKYGWKLSADEPDEVKELKAKTAAKQSSNKQDSNAHIDTGTEPETVESLQHLIAAYDADIARPGQHHMVVKSLKKKKEEAEQRLAALLEENKEPNAAGNEQA